MKIIHSNIITAHVLFGSKSISFGSGAFAVTLELRGTNHIASGSQTNFIFNDGAHVVVFDIFCTGAGGNLA